MSVKHHNPSFGQTLHSDGAAPSLKTIFKGAPLSNIRTITGLALFAALYVALRAVTINLSADLRITFTFLPLACSCMLYGMGPNLILAFVCDLVGWMVHPDGAYVPLFALVIMLRAVIYSLFFYQRKNISFLRALIAQCIAMILCSLILNPLILTFLYQTPFWTMMMPRLIKNLILLPIESIMLYFVLQALPRFARRMNKAV